MNFQDLSKLNLTFSEIADLFLFIKYHQLFNFGLCVLAEIFGADLNALKNYGNDKICSLLGVNPCVA